VVRQWGEERSSLQPKIESVSTTASTRGSFQLIVVNCINKGGRREVDQDKGQRQLAEKQEMHACGRCESCKHEGKDIFLNAVGHKNASKNNHKTPKTTPQHHDYKQLGLDDDNGGFLALELGHGQQGEAAKSRRRKRGVVERLAAIAIGEGDWVLRSHAPSAPTTTATAVTTSWKSATTSYDMRRGWQQQAAVDGLAARRRQAANHPQPELSYSRGKSMRGGVRGWD